MTQGNELDSQVISSDVVDSGQETPTQETSEVVPDTSTPEETPVTQENTGKKLNFADMKAGKLDPKGTPEKAVKTPKTAQYTPNFKFKVLDKELEFEDWAKGVVKDAETEKKVREVFEKAYGIDSIKADRQSLKQNLTEVTNSVKSYEKYHNELNSFLTNKDYDSFFDAIKIPEADIVNYALELVKRKEDPALNAQWQANRQQRLQAQQYESDRSKFASEQTDFAVQKKTFELDTALLAPEAQAIAQAYDNGVGKPNAFRNYIIQLAAAQSVSTGQDIPVKEAVEMALAQVRAINPNFGVSVQNTPARVVTPNPKSVIPTVRGTGSSPVATKYKSLADLKKRASELDAQA